MSTRCVAKACSPRSTAASSSNFAKLDPKLVKQPFDPDNDYSIPYLWGSTGIAVNTDKIKAGTISQWRDLWNPDYKDRLLLTNDMREVFYMGLRLLGYSGNDTDPKHIEAAYTELKKLVPNVRAYNSEAPRMPYLEGETDAGMIWNGEAYAAKQENPAIEFVYPKEGVILWMDSLVIPKTAQHADNALKFIDFVLRPEIAKAISEEIGYASPNLAAVALLDDGGAQQSHRVSERGRSEECRIPDRRRRGHHCVREILGSVEDRQQLKLLSLNDKAGRWPALRFPFPPDCDQL